MSSEISRLFDPLGLLGPIIVTAKIFLQKLWILKLDWDDEVPLHLKRTRGKFRDELLELKHLNIERHVLCSKALSLSTSGEIKVSLLCSKSRVTPIKEVSIPRLELCAAELLSKLIVQVQSSLDLEIHGVHLYSDSTVVLAWIATPPHALKVFVANRVTKIQNYTEDFKWHYVNTAENPADLISRGAFPSKI
ncbi:hypothetical protein AVEN_114534-1 [Araneus ventricosus]|uniref:Uncharacterized protein n=1 Tax=Araneus ventricosus TaxID=182803 RepID=A0A4Y2WH86_ARAVE|nr:hypothetical protein AVEN_114534-1 [Araneus ventricosus]